MAIDLNESPLSLRKIAHEAGVSVGYLRYRYPVLSKDIVDKYKNHTERMKLKKRLKAQLAALRYFTDEKYESHTKSRKQAYRVLLLYLHIHTQPKTDTSSPMSSP